MPVVSRTSDRQRFGPGKISLAPVLFFAFGTLPLAAADRRLLWLLLLPLACAVYVLRARVVVSSDGIEACDGLRVRRLPWSEVEGFDVPSKGRVRVLTDGAPVVLTALPREQVRSFLRAGEQASAAPR